MSIENDPWLAMIQENVYEYISQVKYDNKFNLSDFKTELKKIIGLEPAVKIKWNTTQKINELKRDSGVKDYIEITEKAEQVDITFIDENNKIKQLKFII